MSEYVVVRTHGSLCRDKLQSKSGPVAEQERVRPNTPTRAPIPLSTRKADKAPLHLLLLLSPHCKTEKSRRKHRERAHARLGEEEHLVATISHTAARVSGQDNSQNIHVIDHLLAEDSWKLFWIELVVYGGND